VGWGWQDAIVAVECAAKKIYGLQYHPEVTHSERGLETLKHFLLTLCGCKANWSMADVLDEQLQIIKDKVRGCGRVRGVRSR